MNELAMLLNEEGGMGSEEADTEQLLKNIELMLKSLQDSEEGSVAAATAAVNSGFTNNKNHNNSGLSSAAQTLLQHRILNNNRIIIINNNSGARGLVKQEPVDSVIASSTSKSSVAALSAANNSLGFKKISPKTNTILPKEPNNSSANPSAKPALVAKSTPVATAPPSQLKQLTVPSPETLKATLKKNNASAANTAVAQQPIIVKMAAQQPQEPVQTSQQTLTVLTTMPAAGLPVIITSPSVGPLALPAVPMTVINTVQQQPSLLKTESLDASLLSPSAKRVKQDTGGVKKPESVVKQTPPSSVSSPKQDSAKSDVSTSAAVLTSMSSSAAQKPNPPVAFTIPNVSNVDNFYLFFKNEDAHLFNLIFFIYSQAL
jgi:hypothetical protein